VITKKRNALLGHKLGGFFPKGNKILLGAESLICLFVAGNKEYVSVIEMCVERTIGKLTAKSPVVTEASLV
jgi:hypothetical protein